MSDDPVLVKKLSEEVFEKLYPLAFDLVRPIEARYGPRVAMNVLANAMVSSTALQFGNYMGLLGTWDNEAERQNYCTSMAKAIFDVFQNQRPKESDPHGFSGKVMLR